MARVLLVMPRLPQRLGPPYLGQQLVAAGLLRAGHEVRVVDLSAARCTSGDEAVVAEVARFSPDMVGMTLFTVNAARGYALAERLRGGGQVPLLVAGGPHATVCPGEPEAHGFDVSLGGEGEHAMVALAAGRLDVPRSAPPIEDLDALCFALESYPCFDRAAYSADGRTIVPGGLMTSRGCPARCTFCANYVTGRAYRFRSPASVVAEMVALSERYGVRHFPFWDDAFTALRPRLEALCDAILAEPRLRGVTWTCITPGNMVKPFDLQRMRRAGCMAINFGIESGDYNILRIIQKGQRPEHVRAAVAAAKAEGMTTIVNFMFGFPEEGVAELDRTLELMADLAPHTDFFNNRGVLVPFPGTAIYDRWHAEYRFTGWWLDPAKVPLEPDLFALTADEAQRALETDPTLDLDFFRYSDAVREKIAECVRAKALHNQGTVARMRRAA